MNECGRNGVKANGLCGGARIDVSTVVLGTVFAPARAPEAAAAAAEVVEVEEDDGVVYGNEEEEEKTVSLQTSVNDEETGVNLE